MMLSTQLPILFLAVATVIAAPSTTLDDIPEIIIPQKRAALVLDRLLVALQKALKEDSEEKYKAFDYDGPRASPLRFTHGNDNELVAGVDTVAPRASGWHSKEMDPPLFRPPTPWRRAVADDTSALQRRNQGSGRGRVLRCYFNAVTCF